MWLHGIDTFPKAQIVCAAYNFFDVDILLTWKHTPPSAPTPPSKAEVRKPWLSEVLEQFNLEGEDGDGMQPHHGPKKSKR